MGLALPWRSAGQSSEYADCVESCRNMVVFGGGRNWASFMSVPGIERGTCMGRRRGLCV